VAFIVRYLRRNAKEKGLLGGRRGWFGVFLVLTGARIARRHIGREAEHLTVETLRPGQSLSITAIAPTTRRDRKRSARGARTAPDRLPTAPS
jgi:hypothetical protein